jgi:hypothetical protein
MSQLTDSLRKRQRELHTEFNQTMREVQERQARAAALQQAIAGIDSILRLDGVTDQPDMLSGANGSSVIQPGAGALTLGGKPPQLYDVVVEVLQDKKPHAAPEILERVKNRGVTFGDKDPMKAVGMTLLGISRSKKYKHHGNGLYQKVAD